MIELRALHQAYRQKFLVRRSPDEVWTVFSSQQATEKSLEGWHCFLVFAATQEYALSKAKHWYTQNNSGKKDMVNPPASEGDRT
jgi:1,2-phenylacetyl-CoA epoxidase PaaB subunit